MYTFHKNICTCFCIFHCSLVGVSFADYSNQIPEDVSNGEKRIVMTTHGGYFRITGLLYGESIGDCWIPSQRTGYAELWCFLCSYHVQAVKQNFSCRWFETPLCKYDVTTIILFGVTSGETGLHIRKERHSYIQNDIQYGISRHCRTWWRHQMKTFSALLAICAGNSPVPGEFPTQRPVTRSFDVFFDLHLNEPLSKQWWGWWFETLSRPLWRRRNEMSPV